MKIEILERGNKKKGGEEGNTPKGP